MQKNILNFIFAGALATAAVLVPAQATPVSYDWSGTYGGANLAQFGVKTGDKISGTIKYDAAFAYAHAYGSFGGESQGYKYWDSTLLETSVNFGTLHQTIDLYAMVTNNYWAGDQMIFRSDSTPFGSFDLTLVNSSNTLFTTRNIPDTINLAQFNSNYLRVGNWSGNNAVKSFSPAAAAVPEPGALALFSLGLLGLAAVRRKRQPK